MMRTAWFTCAPVGLGALLVLGTLLAGIRLDAAEPAPADKVAVEDSTQGLEFFEQRIRPVLVRHCYECHDSAQGPVKGGLRLDTRDGMRRGGDSGPAVVPRRVDESLLVGALRHDAFEMPPQGKLPENVIADFVRWIEMGAPDPRTGPAETAAPQPATDLEAGRQFWSFRPLQDFAPPAVNDASWPRTAIDHFVLARLEQQGLRPAADAQRQVLARRLSFDLLGLPPSPEQIDQFVRDERPDAVERLVDRLLDSPHFGQRWGRHWLDVVRYADSVGGGRTRVLHDAWRYRDYVFDALNADRPYDRFLAEHLAGDLLAGDLLGIDEVSERARGLTATGFLLLGPINYELQDKELLRLEVVDEQLDTMGRAFLGLTIGCARCHDHKFDPIPTEDYYALAGIFRSTHSLTPGNVSGFVQRPLPLPAEQQQARERYERQVEPINRQLADARQQLGRLQGSAVGAGKQAASKPVPADSLPGIVVDESQARLAGDWKASSSVGPFVGAGYHYCGAGDASARFEAQLPRAGRYEVRIAHTANPNRASNVPVTVAHAEGQAVRRVNHRRTPPLDGLFVSLGEFSFEAGPAAVIIGCEGLDGLAIADAVQWLPRAEQGTAAGQNAAAEPAPPAIAAEEADRQRQATALQQQIAQLETQLKQLERQAPPAPPLVMAVEDQAEVEDFYVCIRGNLRNPGPVVPRGFLRVLQPAERQGRPEISPGESGRRELAEWLGSPDNPLPARVFVNRVWLHLLGEGLVRTPDNFGQMGERPTHPELLDYLAARFIADGWSVKRLIRRIVLSRVYQLSSDEYPEAEAVDPDNRLLARAHHRRLDAEAIRDLVLSVSGELDLRFGGPAVPASVKSEFGYEFPEGRRSVYLPVFRNRLHDLFEVFDFADPNLVSGRRHTSTLPTQALYLINSPFIMQQAGAAARRLLDEAAMDSERLRLLYRRALGREPSAAERDLALGYLHSAPAGQAAPDERRAEQAWATVCQALMASLDFRYLK
ncbi:MAG: DUF1553 domain-containing protein [Pirellulaceae bacterium]|nr:DUF1553 domain-containing protein [Pirellulaceae bacterium]